MDVPHFDCWHLLGAFPDGVRNDVGSWLLTHGGEALVLEVPPGLTPAHVEAAFSETGTALKFVTASHDHEDHLDAYVWATLEEAFPAATFLHPDVLARNHDLLLRVGGEPVWLIRAPKHSRTDVVTAFRGVAMTGDIETGTLGSVNREVPEPTKRKSMDWLRDFPGRTGYRVHSTVSAHLNSVRVGVDWAWLFTPRGG